MPVTFNALSSPSNKGVSQPPSESPPVDSRDAAMSPLFESALGHFIKSDFSPDELPPLIEAIFERSDLSDKIRCLGEDEAQEFIDAAHETLGRFDLPLRTRASCLRQLYKTCGRHKLIPRSLEVSIFYYRNGSPTYSGGYADVYKGKHRGKDVAVKVIRTCSKSDLEQVFAMFCKEVVIWKTLQHPHVLPLIGVTTSKGRFAMVSEWMNNGNINEFVKANPDINRLKLLGGVAKGLIYIHQQGMIHGDLKGANIVIDQTGNALLADFGLLTIVSNMANSSPPAQGGTTRWMSPELIYPEQYGFETSRPTVSSDCYALGMVIYETISGNRPFHTDKVPATIAKVLRGVHPHRGVGFADDLWGMLKRCWKTRADERPGVEDVLRCLKTNSNLSVPPSPGMDLAKESCPVPISYPPAIPDSQCLPSMGTLVDISEDQAIGTSYPPPGRDTEIEAGVLGLGRSRNLVSFPLGPSSEAFCGPTQEGTDAGSGCIDGFPRPGILQQPPAQSRVNEPVTEPQVYFDHARAIPTHLHEVGEGEGSFSHPAAIEGNQPTVPIATGRGRRNREEKPRHPMEYIPADSSKPLGRPDFEAVHQTKYYCKTTLTGWGCLPPVDFTVQGNEGIRLTDAMNMCFSHLDGRDDPMFVEGGAGPSVSLRIEFMGNRSGIEKARQIPTMNHKKDRLPITRQKLGHDIAKIVKLHLQGSPIEVPFERMYLVRLHHVSNASWQPELWCEASTTP